MNDDPTTPGPDLPDPPPPPMAQQTGHPAVDAALRAVSEVAGAAPADQLPAYQAAHRTLRETLASIDET